MLTIIASCAILMSLFLTWMTPMLVHIQGINLMGGTFATPESSICIVALVAIGVIGLITGASKSYRYRNNWLLSCVYGITVLVVCIFLLFIRSLDGIGPAVCIAGGFIFLAEAFRKWHRRSESTKTE